MFSMRQLKEKMTSVFIEHGQEVVQKLNLVKPNEVIDLQSMFFAFTWDSFAEIAFGVKLGTLTSGSSDFGTAFDAVQRTIDRRWLTPWWKVERYLGRFFGITEEGQFIKRIKVINRFAYSVIENRKIELVRNQMVDQRNDLLSLFLQQKDDDGRPFSDAYLRDVILNFIIAGRDTTAQALSWCVYLLSQHPAVEEKVFEQVDQIYDSDDVHTRIQDNDYLHAVISETLRLYPPVPKDGKITLQADTLPDGTYVPAGAMLLYTPWSQGRMPQLWGEDALEFRPSRWLKEGKFQQESPFKYSVFQAGPRMCLGKSVAYLESKLLLAMISRNFRFSLVPNHKVEPAITITLPMRDGLKMTVTRRR